MTPDADTISVREIIRRLEAGRPGDRLVDECRVPVASMLSILRQIPEELDDVVAHYGRIVDGVLREDREREAFEALLDAVDDDAFEDGNDDERDVDYGTIVQKIAGVQSAIAMSAILNLCVCGAMFLATATAFFATWHKIGGDVAWIAVGNLTGTGAA